LERFAQIFSRNGISCRDYLFLVWGLNFDYFFLQVVILVAGKGTRSCTLTLKTPKETIKFGTKPLIEHVMKVLKAEGISHTLRVP
jgi:hypothetical protein